MPKTRKRRKGRPRARIPWSRFDRLLGTQSDRAVAGIVGCAEISVRSRRKRLGIPPSRPRADSRSRVRIWKTADRFLGRLVDREVAERFGVPQAAVFNRRTLRGIPARGIRPRADWRRFSRMFGRVPDERIAELAGVTRATVHFRRRRLGIPAHRTKTRSGRVSPGRGASRKRRPI